MTKHHSRFDRQLRLLLRARHFLKELNRHSDQLYLNDIVRGPVAQKHYNRATRIINDIEHELIRARALS